MIERGREDEGVSEGKDFPSFREADHVNLPAAGRRQGRKGEIG
jgi:hypothetical protein